MYRIICGLLCVVAIALGEHRIIRLVPFGDNNLKIIFNNPIDSLEWDMKYMQDEKGYIDLEAVLTVSKRQFIFKDNSTLQVAQNTPQIVRLVFNNIAPKSYPKLHKDKENLYITMESKSAKSIKDAFSSIEAKAPQDSKPEPKDSKSAESKSADSQKSTPKPAINEKTTQANIESKTKDSKDSKAIKDSKQAQNQHKATNPATKDTKAQEKSVEIEKKLDSKAQEKNIEKNIEKKAEKKPEKKPDEKKEPEKKDEKKIAKANTESKESKKESTNIGKGKKIVVDAGHGGKDCGAKSIENICEKVIVLEVAKLLTQELKNRGYVVYLTRNSDVYIDLRKRTEFANAKNADLFVSIHANSIPKKSTKTPSGVETYFLSPARSERAEQVAKAENQGDIETMSFFATKSFLNTISAYHLVASHKLAIEIQSGILNIVRKEHNTLDGAVREGPFWVLAGALMPSVLIEIGYLSHKDEGKLLNKKAYQKLLSQGIADGIDGYFIRNY